MRETSKKSKRNLAIVQCLWIGESLSNMEQTSIRSFLRNADEVHLYAYEEVAGIPEGVQIFDANNIINKNKIFKYKGYDSYAGFANLFRYKVLLEKGGYWSDLDIVCLESLPREETYIFASERLFNPTIPKHERFIQANNCFLYTPCGTEIMEFCYNTASSKNPDELKWGDTGPKLLTQAILKFDLKQYVVHPDVICPVDPWDFKQFLFKSIDALTNQDTLAVHLWNEKWRREGLDKNAKYNEHCLYNEVQDMYVELK